MRINEEIGEMPDAARSSYDFGLMLKKKGDLMNAKTHLNKAYTIYKKMKLEKAMDEVTVALKDLKQNHKKIQ